jgi:hypothetical protein
LAGIALSRPKSSDWSELLNRTRTSSIKWDQEGRQMLDEMSANSQGEEQYKDSTSFEMQW